MAEQEICRICLRMEIKMYNLHQSNLKSFYEEIMKCKLNQQERLPPFACYECTTLLQKFEKFRDKCCNGLKKLAELYHNGQISLGKLQEINQIASYQHPFLSKSATVINMYPEPFNEINTESANEINVYPDTNNESIKFYSLLVKEEIDQTQSDHHYDEQADTKIDNDEDIPLSVFLEQNPAKSKKNKESKVRIHRIRKDKEILDDKYWKIYYLNQEEAVNEFEARSEASYYTRAAFKCTDCYKGFSKEEMLLTHQKRMHNKETNSKECKFCRMRFKYENHLKNHFVGHYTRFQCLRCEKRPVFNLESSASLHNETHEDVLKKCLHCGKEFKHLSTLYTHLRTHRSAHVCARCGVGFVSAAGLRQHQLAKHYDGDGQASDDDDVTSLHCASCDVTFVSKTAYTEHFFHSEMHSDTVGETFNMEKKKIFRKKYRKAIAEKLGINQDCNMKMGHFERRAMKRRKARTTNQPTTCRICDETFDGLVKCIRHHRATHPGMAFHGDGQRHVCEICGALLAPGSISAHLNNHSREKLFSCSDCGRTFTQPSTLKRHILTHTGERPWPCSVCGKTFTQSNSMKLHYRTVHLKEPHPKRNRSKKLSMEINNKEEIRKK